MTEKSKKTSIYDIAKALGISASTVSRALQNHTSISDSRKELIREKAKELNYRPNLVAVNLKTGKTRTIGVLVPNINRFFFSSVIEGVEDEAYRRNYDVLICQSKDNKDREEKILSNLSQGKVDGIIASVAYPDNNLSMYEELVDMEIPLVFFDRASVDAIQVGSVRVDDYKGGYSAVKHLLLQGNKKIFHFSGPLEVTVWRNRYRGWRDALEDEGIEIQDHWLQTESTDKESGRKMMRAILERGDLPDAIFCAGDYAALGVIQELRENGLRVPEDIAIVGFANEPIDEMVRPTISSICQSSFRMGSLAAKMLFDNLETKEAMVNITIAPELKVRESSLFDRRVKK